MADLRQAVVDYFVQTYGRAPEFIVRAPGRVNLIGEHTDYNDGFVLPAAIDRAIWIALRPLDEPLVRIYSKDFDDPAEFPIDSFELKIDGWGKYAQGVGWAIQASGLPLKGWEGCLLSDVPVGAGLSSSAALQLAAARAFQAMSGWEWGGARMALLAQRAEFEFAGVRSGIMDQMISALGKPGCAMMLDCRTYETSYFPLPEGVGIAVLDTMTRRQLEHSAYNERVEQCQAAARYFGVPSLRDVTLEELIQAEGKLSPVVYWRARHVLTENERTLEAASALLRGDAYVFGRLMDESHTSLRDDYEVSSNALDLMVSIAREIPGCFGARMTGAGFGGCAVALVQEDLSDAFTAKLVDQYQAHTGIRPAIYVCRATGGAECISLTGE